MMIPIRNLLILFLIAFPGLSSAQIILSGGVSQQTPGGFVIEVNGVIIGEDGDILGFYTDWGDGNRTTGPFPTHHRYQSPGDYTITMQGFDDQGNETQFTFDHSVTALPSTDVASVVLTNYAVTLKEGGHASVGISAMDVDGLPLSLAGRDVILTPLVFPANTDAQYNEGSIDINAPLLGSADSWMSLYFVTVDGEESEKPLSILVSKHDGSFTSLEGDHVLSYLPADFLSVSGIPLEDFRKVFDRGFEAENLTVKGGLFFGEAFFQAIGYAPPVYGVSGNPLLLGDPANPANWPDGMPHYWNVVFHEMGHNFHGIVSLFNSLAVPGPFYQETIAEWYVQYVLDFIIENHSGELTPNTMAFLQLLQQGSRDYHEFEWANYIDSGKAFDYFQTGQGSHPLVHLIYSYCDEHGWDRISKFLEQFDILRIARFAELISSYGGRTVENRVTVMAAALALTFGTDVKSDFESLNFPVNTPLYEALIMWDTLFKDGFE